MTKVSIIGAGNFGYALTYHLARKKKANFDLFLYDHRLETIDYIKNNRTHPKFFPLIELPAQVQLIDNLPNLIDDCDVLILAMVSTALESVLAQIKPLIAKKLCIVSVMKALNDDTGAPLSQVIEEALPNLPISISILAGGTTGLGLTQEEYLGATLAAPDEDKHLLQTILASEYLWIQLTDDILGVQYASSFKNLISVVVGILKGLGFEYGTQTHALSLIAHECEKLALTFGAQPSTFSLGSQCWGNDMVMSATGNTRNQQLGLMLGEGVKFSTAIADMKEAGKTAESVNTLASLGKIADLSHYPLLNFLEKLYQHQVEVHQIVKVIENYS